MAYNLYQPYYGYTPQQLQAMQQMAQQQQTQPQIQNGGFVSVRSQKEALDYPIAPGNSITFIDENAMRCYIKSKGFSPFERPKFDTYRLVREEPPKQAENTASNDTKEKESNSMQYAFKDDINDISEQISALKSRINSTVERVDALTEKVDTFAAKRQPKKKDGDAE